MKSKFKILLFILLLLIIPNKVMAADGDNYICVEGYLYDVIEKGDASLYEITRYYEMLNYIEEHNINLYATETKNPITGLFQQNREYRKLMEFMDKYGDIYNKYGANANKSPFKTTPVNQKCNLIWKDNQYNWTSCPTNEQYNTANAPFTSIRLQESIVTGFTFDQSKGQFYIEVKDIFDSRLLVRAVRNNRPNSEYFDYASLQSLGYIGSNEIHQLNDSGVARIYFAKDATVRLEFYIKPGYSGDCAGAFVGFYDDVAPSYADVANPWINSSICKDFKENYAYIPTTPVNYKEMMVPECYRSTVEYFSELSTITENSIKNKIEEVKSIFTANQTAALKNLQCHYDVDGVRETAGETVTFVYNPSGSTSSSSTITGDYWAALCTETVTVNYDQPKKVIAGAGFTYDVDVTVTRKCVPFAQRQVSKLPKCTYASSCWGGPAHHYDDAGAGPNDDFDDCVNSCDGGQYSKECIQQCYEKVYKGKDGEITSNQMSFNYESFLDSITAVQVASSGCSKRTKDSPNYCYEENNWSGDWSIPTTKNTPKKTTTGRFIYELAARNNYGSKCENSTHCYTFHGKRFTYLNTCNSETNPTLCYEVYTSKPHPYCSDNPTADYDYEISKADEEYRALLAEIKKYEEAETVTMSIIDTYKTESGSKLTTTFLEDKVKLTGGVVKYGNNTYKETANVKLVKYASKNGVDYTKSVPEIEVSKSYKIELPRTVIDQLTTKEKYVTESYRKGTDEIEAGNKYYTDINSGTFNNYLEWTDGYSPSTTDNAKRINSTKGNNINVLLENLGTVQSGSNVTASYTWDTINIDCFYGVLNQRYLTCDDEKVCDIPCGPGDICTGGLQYYFRQVNLSDLFPDNRNPRWNWTSNASVYDSGYGVDPTEVIEEIEQKGDAAYNESPSYEINLTSANIRNIRRANKGKDYQTYYEGTECSTVVGSSGKEVCKTAIDSYVDSFVRNTELGSND